MGGFVWGGVFVVCVVVWWGGVLVGVVWGVVWGWCVVCGVGLWVFGCGCCGRGSFGLRCVVSVGGWVWGGFLCGGWGVCVGGWWGWVVGWGCGAVWCCGFWGGLWGGGGGG
ncbi:hypothetical protein RA267_27780, partial [Pseudomonas syringae pv. tagetis]|uniref:hypothetical protein n=1 Tax=Pseudomonas syringae group genomosp. 7 TaxID=251699 RepID=UPI00377022EB